jgi:transcriptional regulator with XRE-family HTH domain
MSAIQDILRDLRDRGFTQVEISRRTGIPQPRLSRWESGAVPAGADDALRLRALQEEAASGDGAEPEKAVES